MGLVENYYPGQFTYETAPPSDFRRTPYFARVQKDTAKDFCDYRVGFVRDPYDRFRSLISHLDDEKPALKRRRFGTLTIDGLINTIRGGADNRHWRPQIEFLDVASHLFPYEHLNQWWHAEFGRALSRVNEAQSKKPLTIEQIAFVEDHYARDIELYQKVKFRLAT